MDAPMGGLRQRVMLLSLNAVAAVGFAVVTLTSQRSIGLLAAALGLAVLVWRGSEVAANETIGAQLLIACGALIYYFRSVPNLSFVPFAVIGIGAGALTVGRKALAVRIKRPSIEVAKLPGYVGRAAPTPSATRLYVAGLGVIGLEIIGGVARINPWVIAAATLAVCAAMAATAFQLIRARREGPSADDGLRNALMRFGPRFVFYFSTQPNSEHQVAMWYPYLTRIGLPFVIIVREAAAFPIVTSMTDVPVVYCADDGSLEQLITPSMNACFYAANGVKNSQMVRFAQLTHIQLLHGDSDKVSSYNPFTAIYDRIFVAGQAGIDRYGANGVSIPAQKFDIVGRPQIEQVAVNAVSIADVPANVVLYATTWAGNYAGPSYCSLHHGEKIVRGLLDAGATVILRPHPYARRDPETTRQLAQLEQILAADRDMSGRRHLYGDSASGRMSLFECINAADAMISDVSGVASDWLFSEKPFALTNVLGEDRVAFETAFPLARAAYVLDQDVSNLDEVLAELLKTDSLTATRRALKTYYLGDFPAASYADAFVDAARKYVTQRRS